MTEWVSRLALGSLWALIWHFGIIAGVLILALLAAWFIPVGKKASLIVALCAAIILVTAGIYTKLGADYVQAKWNAAEKADYSAALKARAKADKAIPGTSDPAFSRRMRHDRYNRDNERSIRSLPPFDLFGRSGHPQHDKANPRP